MISLFIRLCPQLILTALHDTNMGQDLEMPKCVTQGVINYSVFVTKCCEKGSVWEGGVFCSNLCYMERCDVVGLLLLLFWVLAVLLCTTEGSGF